MDCQEEDGRWQISMKKMDFFVVCGENQVGVLEDFRSVTSENHILTIV